MNILLVKQYLIVYNAVMAKETLHPAVKAHYQRIGSKGGRNRALNLSAARRRQIASMGGKARRKAPVGDSEK